MAKMKVYELAKELDKSSKDIMNYLKEQGVEVKSHMSNLEDRDIVLINNKFTDKKAAAPAVKPSNVTTTAAPDFKETVKRSGQSSVYHAGGSSAEQNVQTHSSTSNVKNATGTTQGATTNRPYQGTNQNTNPNTNQNRPSQGTGANRPYQGTNQNTNQNRPSQGTGANRPYQGTNQGTNQNTNQNRPSQGTGVNRPYQGTNQNTNQNRPAQGTGANSQYRPNPANRNTFNNTNNTGNNTYNKPSNAGNNTNRTSGNTGNTSNNTGGYSNNYSGNSNNNNRNNTGRNNTYNKNGRNNNNRNNVKVNPNAHKDPNRKGAFIMPKPVVVEREPEDAIKTIIIPETLTLKELADKMKMPAAALVKKLFLEGKMYSINQDLTFEEAEEMALEYEFIAQLEEQVDVIEELLKEDEDDISTLEKRSPVICVMGHVDHGKTSLLDAIRETHVTSREAGGITQHIGAYVVELEDESITFLDTPGHEAFTSMRMRGAKSTDIAILVVAADDGVMPQTVEAINHAKAAGIEIIVAINKIDKESANIERVKQELVEHQLVAEDWGGDTIFVPVSAHTKEGIPQLLEMILLTAEISELKANPNRKARGLVIEAQLDKGRGPVATILVQKGTLHVGDSLAIGAAHGKVRAMMDDKGRRVKEAGPSTPVEILGLNDVPGAGEIVVATDNEKEARAIAEAYIKQGREKLLQDTKAKLSLDGLFSQIQAGNIKELNLIVKADVQGSVEAVKQSLLKLSNDEVAIRIIHGGVGTINESDVTLASASNAIIIGFNVRPDNTAKEIADHEKVDLRLYRVIYNAIEDIEAAMKGMLDPIFEEKVLGHAEVRQVFTASGLGTIAGSYVLDGKVIRGSQARILREGKLIFEGALASVKRFKDDVKEVASGYECGLVFEKFNDIHEFDQVEIYIMQEVPR